MTTAPQISERAAGHSEYLYDCLTTQRPGTCQLLLDPMLRPLEPEHPLELALAKVTPPPDDAARVAVVLPEESIPPEQCRG